MVFMQLISIILQRKIVHILSDCTDFVQTVK